MKTAIFFERDGILNHWSQFNGRPKTPTQPNEFQVNTSLIPDLLELKEAGFLLIATTNQPGVSTGTIHRGDLDRMHRKLMETLPLDDIFTCPHDPADECPCHKPRTGLFQEAAFKHHIILEHSFVVSDKWQDAKAAQYLGCTSVMIESPWTGKNHYDIMLPSLDKVAARILLYTGNSMALTGTVS